MAGRRRAVAAAALLVLAAAPARAQDDGAPLVIDHADELRRVFEGDSLTYYLEGNVRAHRGALHMRGQRSVIHRTSGVADFTRDVHFWDVTTELYADHVSYTEGTDVALASGSVQVIDRQTGSNVTADTVRYDRRLGLVTAWPRPHGVLLPRDTTEQDDPFNVWADTMRFLTDSTRSEFVGVRKILIERTDLTAIGDSLFYSDATGLVALRISPQIETRETFLTASTIDVELVEEELESVIALGGARAITKADSVPATVPPAFGSVSQTSFLEGDSIHVSFDGEAIEWLVAEGNARSLSYARESEPAPVETWSVNYLIGHKLTLTFEGDTLRTVVATGGSRGVYRQEDVRIGGPEVRPSEPIPWPGAALAGPGPAVAALAAGRRR